MNDLKSCPFCGKKPKIYRDISSEMSGHGAWCIIQCKPMFRKPHLKIEEGKALWKRAFEYAVKEWNRRADNEQIKALSVLRWRSNHNIVY